MAHPPSEHFQGKSVAEHLKEARTKGAMASMEIHGTEMSGSVAAFADASKEVAIALSVLWVILSPFFLMKENFAILLLFAAGWTLWKCVRSAMLGWSRVERLHRLIEEERWEIEHHRAQERSELTEMYRAKGLSGKLLEEVIDVLMADDHRLLQIMLEEELGLTLEVYEHPLKQAFGAFCGAAGASALCLFGLWLFPSFGLPLAAALVLICSATLSAKIERNKIVTHVVWNLATGCMIAGCAYFLTSLYPL
jgi:VIT1/CCC1 family predicted Fe2+/Mn2+ transporter